MVRMGSSSPFHSFCRLKSKKHFPVCSQMCSSFFKPFPMRRTVWNFFKMTETWQIYALPICMKQNHLNLCPSSIFLKVSFWFLMTDTQICPVALLKALNLPHTPWVPMTVETLKEEPQIYPYLNLIQTLSPLKEWHHLGSAFQPLPAGMVSALWSSWRSLMP